MQKGGSVTTQLNELAEIGQAVWLDYIRRTFILDGELARLINVGVRGVTSNPSIFEKAIAGSDDYDTQLADICGQLRAPLEIYETLALRDIQMAADTLRPVYEATDGRDGYVSLEVNPDLAHDTQSTLEEARRLFAAVGRPNTLIKVPATSEGLPAIETLIGEGINVNVTLMFSLDQYDAVAEAYLAGLEKLIADGGEPKCVASVASFFVSRVDVKVDALLDAIGTPEAARLKGTIGIANAKMAYQRFRKIFAGARWERLAKQGARVQRVLWASTSTKNPDYPDTLYVDGLIGPHTVNTLPPETLDAFLDHGTVASTLDEGLDEARTKLASLTDLGIDLDQVTYELLIEGVEKFSQPFASLMRSIAEKCRSLQGGRLEAQLGAYEELVAGALEEIARDEILARLWDHDYHIWQSDPSGIADRLGWLDAPARMRRHISSIMAFVDEVRGDGFTDALLLGMGGSSLAPDVFSRIFGPQAGYLQLNVLDSTDPDAVRAAQQRLPLAKTLFIVASKSGTTTETLSFFRHFYNQVSEVVGAPTAGEHFIAITDPGTPLADLGRELGFRAVFLNDPTIGGRYSALSHFGLVPAGLAGLDLASLLDSALELAYRCPTCTVTGNLLGAELGAIMGECTKAGRDKLTLVAPPGLAPLGDWVEQLIAESTGKSGTGVLPVVGEPLGSPQVYGDDRVFVFLSLKGQVDDEEPLSVLRDAGHPVVRLTVPDLADLGQFLYIWGLAVPIAGYRLGIHPFNQPNVEAAKVQARELIALYREQGALPDDETSPVEAESLHRFLAEAGPGDYIALQAYLPPNAAITAALQRLRLQLRDRYRLATTVGYGPRYLHSTGQLHKGDRGNGVFVQFTADPELDLPIPDEAGRAASTITFGVLERAQALGDRRALLDAGRPVIHFHLDADPLVGLTRLFGGAS